MKKGILLTFAIGLFALSAFSQETRLNGYANYVFDDSFETFNSNTSFFSGKIKGGLQWGAGLEFFPKDDYGVELMYLRQDAEVPVNYYRTFDNSRTLDVGINNILLGGTRYTRPNDRVEGYGGFMMGAAIYNNKNPQPGEPGTITKFAWGLRLGGNIWATDRVGIKLQTQFLSVVQALGGAFYVSPGGTGTAFSSYSTVFQFGLGGGLIFRLGD